MPALKNPGHESFCQHRAAGKTCDESYRLAGYKPDRHHAARLATYGHIVARIAEIQAKAAIRAEVTIDTITAQLDEDRALAFKLGQASAAVAASVAKAKLFGLAVDRHTVNATHNYAMMTEDELRYELAVLNAEARALKSGRAGTNVH